MVDSLVKLVPIPVPTISILVDPFLFMLNTFPSMMNISVPRPPLAEPYNLSPLPSMSL